VNQVSSTDGTFLRVRVHAACSIKLPLEFLLFVPVH